MSTIKKRFLAKKLLRLTKRKEKTEVGDLSISHNVIEKRELTLQLADIWGFCYGVLYAIKEVGRIIENNKDNHIWVLGDLIHNPLVNQQLKQLGANFIDFKEIDRIKKNDTVVIPAFGTRKNVLEKLRDKNLNIINTTCPEVQTVEDKVQEFNKNGYTAIIHGKYSHQESIATSSYAQKYLIVKDLDEASYVCNYITAGGDKKEFIQRFQNACSENFDPDKDLEKIGLANQTTMLLNESFEIFQLFNKAIIKRDGNDNNFNSIKTICSATQDRQDAVKKLIDQNNFDLFIVVGGHNSSNTQNLARTVAQNATIPVYHVEDANSFNRDEITHLPPGQKTSAVTNQWLPPGKIKIGITAGASTPHSQLESVLKKLLSFYR